MPITDSQRETLLDRLKAGDTLRAACRVAEIKEASRVLELAAADEAFGAQYVRARELGYMQMADDLLDVADDQAHDPNSRRIAVDTRKWLLSKALPKLYGDKLDLTGGVKASVTLTVTKEDEAL